MTVDGGVQDDGTLLLHVCKPPLARCGESSEGAWRLSSDLEPKKTVHVAEPYARAGRRSRRAQHQQLIARTSTILP